MRKNVNDFYNSCLTSEKQELASYLIEDGLLNSEDFKINKKNMLDEIYLENLDILKNKKHMLTLEEENFISAIASRLKYF